MIEPVLVIIFTTCMFLAMVLSLALKPELSKKVLGYTLVIASIGGLLLYGYGYSVVEKNHVVAILKALHSTCGMIVGGDNLKDIASAPFIKKAGVVVAFWVVRTMAFYAFAGTVFSLIGAKILEKFRVLLSRQGNMVIILGIKDVAFNYGKECVKEKNTSVVFLTPEISNEKLLEINQMGAAVQSGQDVMHPTEKMLKSIGVRPGSRKIQIYLMESEQTNYKFAQELKACFETMNILPEQTSLVLFGEEESLAGKLQVYGRGEEMIYGFGNVSIFQFHRQLSRLITQICPPSSTITFDENAVAQDDFELLLLGFGRLGQTILREFVRNGQFKGSHFKATVIDPNCIKATGYFQKRYPETLRQYDIHLIEQDGRGEATFDYLEHNLHKVKYVISAIGDQKANEDAARQVSAFLRSYNINIPVIACGKTGITSYHLDDYIKKDFPLYTRDNLDFSKVDHMAMKVNHKYSNNPDHSLWDDWRECDYFSRMSCRAVADFIPSNLHMLHMTMEEAQNLEGNQFHLTKIQKDNLGETEHLRWMAFHFTMGYSQMTWEEWEKRAAIYQEQTKKGETNRIRIGKDNIRRKHICLCDWDELTLVDEREEAITGKPSDYKQYDLDNVLLIPELMKDKN